MSDTAVLSNEVVMVRNTMGGPTVFTHPATNQQVEWQGAGDPHGGDVQPIPLALFSDVQFQRSVQRGIFVRVADDYDSVIEAHRKEWEEAEHRRQNASLDSLEALSQNDIHTYTCVAPKGRANSGITCDVPVPMTPREHSEKPPLCIEHKSDAAKFVSQETDEIEAGKPKVKWTRVQLGLRERQQS